MRLVLVWLLTCSACATTRPVVQPPPCARIVALPHRRSELRLGQHRVDRDAFEAELSRFPDAKAALGRERALFASGAALAFGGAPLFMFGTVAAIARGDDRAFAGMAITTVGTFLTGVGLWVGADHQRELARASYNAQIGDRCPRTLDDDFPP